MLEKSFVLIFSWIINIIYHYYLGVCLALPVRGVEDGEGVGVEGADIDRGDHRDQPGGGAAICYEGAVTMALVVLYTSACRGRGLFRQYSNTPGISMLVSVSGLVLV